MRIDFKVPVKWDELTPWQRDRLGRIFFNPDQVDKELFKKLMAIILFLPKPSLKHVAKLFILLCRMPLTELISYTDFLFDPDHRLTSFKPAYTVRSGFCKSKVYGPADRLNNITILELSYADTFFYKWITEGQDVDLHRLCAVLYRPADPDAPKHDSREAFNQLLLPANAVLTDQIPLHQKYMIALAFQGSRDLFAKRFPKVFPKAKSSQDTDVAPAVKKKKAYSPFTNIINSMALDEVQPFGPLEDTERANAGKFLEIYNESIIRLQKREQLLKKK